MIDLIDFRRRQQIETAKLQLHESADSYFYAHANDKNIPVFYNSKYNLLQWLDRWTKERAKNILVDDLVELNEDEREFIENMRKIYYSLANSISSTYKDFDYSYGGAYETIFDYRYINKYLNGNFNIVDFGAGDGRHGSAFSLNNNQGLYFAVDVMEFLYILQNTLFSHISSENFYEILDYELENRELKINEIQDKSIIHLPSWKTTVIENSSIDLILANHILDELTKFDLYNFLDFAKRVVSENGIVYSRGTIHNEGKKKLKNYHGCNIYEEFKSRGFEEVENIYYPSQAYNVVIWKKSN